MGPRLSFRNLPGKVAAPDPCLYPALPPGAPLPLYGRSWAGQDLSYPWGWRERQGEGSGVAQPHGFPSETSDWWGLGERVYVPV